MVYLMRHLRPAVAAGICYGRLDLPVALEASRDIAAALHVVPRMDAIVSSPAIRSAALAEALADRDGIACSVDDRLLELDFGDWEGRPWDAIARTELDAWAADVWSVAPGGGESLQDLWRRVTACGEALHLPDWQARDAKLLIVAHQGSLRAIWAQWLKLPLEQFFEHSFDFAAAGICVLPVNQHSPAAFPLG